MFKGKGHSVFNTPAVKMMFHWLGSLPRPLQLWLMLRLEDMCSYGSHNKQRCCIAGVLSTILSVLADSQTSDLTFQQDVEGESGGRLGYWVYTEQ